METLYHTVFETRIGPLTAIASGAGLCALEFDKPDRQALLQGRLAHWFQNCQFATQNSHPVLDETGAWLREYFAGRFDTLNRVRLDLRGTAFEREVWRQLLEIAPGKTATYGELAARLGLANGARAIGLAVGRNPVGIIVPCHRVIGSNGSLTGYGGGLKRKRWLLEHEGARTRGLFSTAGGLA